MKRFDFAIAPKELAEAMMADLGNGPTTVNGDRSSTYFLVAKAEKEQNGEITAALRTRPVWSLTNSSTASI